MVTSISLRPAELAAARAAAAASGTSVSDYLRSLLVYEQLGLIRRDQMIPLDRLTRMCWACERAFRPTPSRQYQKQRYCSVKCRARRSYEQHRAQRVQSQWLRQLRQDFGGELPPAGLMRMLGMRREFLRLCRAGTATA